MVTYDSLGILRELNERYNETTPDYLERKLEGQIPVFVYGSLREGFHNHGVIQGSPYIGEAVTSIEKYEMREPSHGGFPLVFLRGIRDPKTNASSGKVRGEVYVVDPRTLLELDRLENNGKMYTRSLQYVYLKDQNLGGKGKPIKKVWMYLSNEDFWGTHHHGVSSTLHKGNRFYDWADAKRSGKEDKKWLI